jgi:Sap, sulfolipid-1-addressing protein
VADAIGGLLPFAVGVAISPMPIVAVVLLLLTPRARANGTAFLAGWIGGIVALGAVLLMLSTEIGASEQGEPASWLSWLKLLLGVLLAFVSVRQWASRERRQGGAPKWMKALDSFTPAKAAVAGVLLGTISPKNLLLVIGGAAAVAQAGATAVEEAVAWAIFTAIASLGVGAPVVIRIAAGERATARLDQINTWMTRNNAAIIAVVCLILGAKLVGDAFAALS